MDKPTLNRPTAYEQLGIVIPGAAFLFGLLLLFPEKREFLTKDGISVGGLGIYILLSYAAGQLIAAVGNVAENVFWRMSGGMPSNWVLKSETSLVSSDQLKRLAEKLKQLGICVNAISDLSPEAWWPISRQIYVEVTRHGKPDRLDTFNGNYGLNRGLAGACFVLAAIAAVEMHWRLAAMLAVLSIIYGYRAYRFGVDYARELYVQFLSIEGEQLSERTATKKPRQQQ